MNTIASISILMISQFIANVVTHTQHRIKHYAIAALIGLLAVLASNKLYGHDELKYLRYLTDTETKCVLTHINVKDLTAEQRRFYIEKMDFHEQNARRCFEDAKSRCWWLPEISDRDKARYCFSAIGGLAVPGTPQAALIRSLVSLMLNYGLDCMDEWDYINNKLYWAEYHWDMYEFYANVLVNA
jgi:hypothetical protein